MLLVICSVVRYFIFSLTSSQRMEGAAYGEQCPPITDGTMVEWIETLPGEDFNSTVSRVLMCVFRKAADCEALGLYDAAIIAMYNIMNNIHNARGNWFTDIIVYRVAWITAKLRAIQWSQEHLSDVLDNVCEFLDREFMIIHDTTNE